MKLLQKCARCFLLVGLLSGTAGATNAVVTTCNETGFNTAFNTVDSSGGGTITFSCGAAPVTITFTAASPLPRAVSGNDVIDVGNLITLDGGSVYPFFQVFNGKSLVLKNITLQHGAFNTAHALENFGSLTLNNVVLKNNISTDSAVQNSGSLLVLASTFSANAANAVSGTRGGAAIRNEGGDVVVVGSQFTNNTVQTPAAQFGGAIWNNGGDLQVHSTAFADNNAFNGAAIDNENGSVHVGNSTFTNNIANYGGAIRNSSTSPNLTIVASTFAGNQAGTGNGGAILNYGPVLTVDQSQFIGNSAGVSGGAIACVSSSATSTITNSAFGTNQGGNSGNSAVQNGGAVYSTCGLIVSNATFQGNSVAGAAYGGGAIYQSSSQSSSVTYATISGNSAPVFGGGIYNDGGASGMLTLGKSIIAANSGSNCDGGSFISGGYNLANDMSCGGAFGVDATNKANATLPLGAFANNGGPTSTMLPLAGNQAINFVPKASCAATYDQRGAVRPAGANCDAGAVELSGIIDKIFADGFEFH